MIELSNQYLFGNFYTMEIKKRVLLTGASGTVGFQVLKQLSEQSDLYDITVFDLKTKRSERKLKPFANTATIVYGDISKFEEVRKACHNQDFVIHLAAIIPPVADDFPLLSQKINVQGTENLVKALSEFSPQAFFMYSSSISVYGDRVDSPLINVSDNLMPSPRDEYAKSKIEAEHIIQNSSLKWTIFRLAAIMGDHKISKLMFHMPLKTAMEIATPADTARAFVIGINHCKELTGNIFNLGGGSSCRISYKAFLLRSFDIFGLGSLSFPDSAFATKNFHCGFYRDGDILNSIVDFRRDTIDSYFEQVAAGVPAIQRFFTKIIRPIIKRKLLSQSEPHAACKSQNQDEINHYFKEEDLSKAC